MDMDAKNIKRITIEREDGTVDVLTRGLVADFREAGDDEEGVVNFDICGMSGKDLVPIINAMIQLGYQIGYLRDEEEASDE